MNSTAHWTNTYKKIQVSLSNPQCLFASRLHKEFIIDKLSSNISHYVFPSTLYKGNIRVYINLLQVLLFLPGKTPKETQLHWLTLLHFIQQHRFKSCSQSVREFQWWGSLTMVPTGNKTKQTFVSEPHHKKNNWSSSSASYWNFNYYLRCFSLFAFSKRLQKTFIAYFT